MWRRRCLSAVRRASVARVGACLRSPGQLNLYSVDGPCLTQQSLAAPTGSGRRPSAAAAAAAATAAAATGARLADAFEEGATTEPRRPTQLGSLPSLLPTPLPFGCQGSSPRGWLAGAGAARGFSSSREGTSSSQQQQVIITASAMDRPGLVSALAAGAYTRPLFSST